MKATDSLASSASCWECRFLVVPASRVCPNCGAPHPGRKPYLLAALDLNATLCTKMGLVYTAASVVSVAALSLYLLLGDFSGLVKGLCLVILVAGAPVWGWILGWPLLCASNLVQRWWEPRRHTRFASGKSFREQECLLLRTREKLADDNRRLRDIRQKKEIDGLPDAEQTQRQAQIVENEKVRVRCAAKLLAIDIRRWVNTCMTICQAIESVDYDELGKRYEQLKKEEAILDKIWARWGPELALGSEEAQAAKASWEEARDILRKSLLRVLRQQEEKVVRSLTPLQSHNEVRELREETASNFYRLLLKLDSEQALASLESEYHRVAGEQRVIADTPSEAQSTRLGQ